MSKNSMDWLCATLTGGDFVSFRFFRRFFFPSLFVRLSSPIVDGFDEYIIFYQSIEWLQSEKKNIENCVKLVWRFTFGHIHL